MQIKNEEIEIKIGDKKVKLHNYILQDYLDKLSYRQLHNMTSLTHSKSLTAIYLRFDEPLPPISEDDELSAMLFSGSYISHDNEITETLEKTENKVVYNYKISKLYAVVYGEQSIVDLNDYAGHKITAIGFGIKPYLELFDEQLSAYVDISHLNIYVEENKTIYVTRTDTIKTDMNFYSKDMTYSPHLRITEKETGIIEGFGLTNYLEDDGLYYSLTDLEEDTEKAYHYKISGDLKQNSLLKNYIGFSHVGFSKATFSQYKYYYVKYKVYKLKDDNVHYLDTEKTYKLYNNYNGDFKKAEFYFDVKRG